jgi:hypothetical protein
VTATAVPPHSDPLRHMETHVTTQGAVCVPMLLALLATAYGCASHGVGRPPSERTGVVVYVEGEEVTIDLARSDGIKVNGRLLVFAVDREIRHPLSDALLRVRLTPIALINVVEAGVLSSIARIHANSGSVAIGHFVRPTQAEAVPADSWWEEATWWRTQDGSIRPHDNAQHAEGQKRRRYSQMARRR